MARDASHSMSCAWIWTWPSLGVSLKVAHSASRVFDGFKQSSTGVERGGQLFVDCSKEDGLWLVTATPPHPRDDAGIHWLQLDERRCRDEIRRNNAAGLRWVGVWHSHPEDEPHYSSRDLSSLKSAATSAGDTLPHPLAVIVGRDPPPTGVKAWSLRIERMVLAEFHPP